MVTIAIAWFGFCIIGLLFLAWELKNAKPCPPDCIDCYPGPQGRAENGCDDCYFNDTCKPALKEQGAGDAYMNRVKAELCGPFGKMMP